MAIKPWQIISSRLDRTYHIFRFRTDRARSPRTGKDYDFYVLESRPWVNIIPLTPDNKVVLVRQYRHGIQAPTIEIPGGLVDDGDTPLEAAKRELLEETGYLTDTWISLGSVRPNPAIQNNQCHTFLAKDVFEFGDQKLDETEDIEVLCRPLKDIPGLIQKGTINHALILCAFFKYSLAYGHESFESCV